MLQSGNFGSANAHNAIPPRKLVVMMSVHEATARDLAKLPADLRDSALAETALALAGEMDKAKNGATSKSMCARALQEVLRDLRSLAPPEEVKDGIDQLAARRVKRRAGVAKTPRVRRT